jgi:hypothetical protein
LLASSSPALTWGGFFGDQIELLLQMIFQLAAFPTFTVGAHRRQAPRA